jgi:peptide-methionine (R)-S-oxide reductase
LPAGVAVAIFSPAGREEKPMSDVRQPKIEKSPEEWKRELTPEQFHVTRKHGTERAFTGPYWDDHRPGTYHCVCCDAPLFDADTKFDSGTGWPSFFAPIDGEAVEEHSDRSFFMKRTEIRCARCDAHLGHVFPDGPPPTGLRYCMNGTALKLKLPDGTPV